MSSMGSNPAAGVVKAKRSIVAKCVKILKTEKALVIQSDGPTEVCGKV